MFSNPKTIIRLLKPVLIFYGQVGTSLRDKRATLDLLWEIGPVSRTDQSSVSIIPSDASILCPTSE